MAINEISGLRTDVAQFEGPKITMSGLIPLFKRYMHLVDLKLATDSYTLDFTLEDLEDVPFNPNINTLKLYNSSIEDHGLVESLLTYRLLIAGNTILLNVHYSGTDRISGMLAPC